MSNRDEISGVGNREIFNLQKLDIIIKVKKDEKDVI